jgi:hypothetical protein
VGESVAACPVSGELVVAVVEGTGLGNVAAGTASVDEAAAGGIACCSCMLGVIAVGVVAGADAGAGVGPSAQPATNATKQQSL